MGFVFVIKSSLHTALYKQTHFIRMVRLYINKDVDNFPYVSNYYFPPVLMFESDYNIFTHKCFHFLWDCCMWNLNRAVWQKLLQKHFITSFRMTSYVERYLETLYVYLNVAWFIVMIGFCFFDGSARKEKII